MLLWLFLSCRFEDKTEIFIEAQGSKEPRNWHSSRIKQPVHLMLTQ